jgi:TonB family protein
VQLRIACGKMAAMPRSISIFCIIVFAASSLTAQTQAPAALPMPKDPAEILQLALAQNDIDVDDLAPWHLKATFQLFDAKGKPTETVKLDEIWAGPQQQRRVWTSPSFNQIEIINQKGKYRSGNHDGVPALLQTAHQIIVHPMPSEDDIAGTKPYLQKKKFGSVDLNCIMLSQPLDGLDDAVLGLFPTYCFDLDRPVYRIGYEYIGTTYVANNVGAFKQRFLALKDAVTVDRVQRVQGTVDDLRNASSEDMQAFIPGADAVAVIENRVRVSSGVAAAHRVGGADPIYPEGAKHDHVTGTVVLHAIIGRDGHIHSLRILSAKNAELAVSAIAAVRMWTYSPYLLNGVPTEVDTQITVNFKMGF